ncbi:hypothetical protein [Agrobacterium sp.]|jgi:aldose 1-epimerase|uniref:aldose epimerase family protein n=1 Tax=Agrobacterium sp. TaxID=361 RepID=UPI0028ABBF1E|nr:hypothetical protein [Agrobacterium sp.]
MERQLTGTKIYEIASAQLVAQFCPAMGGRLLSLHDREARDIVIPTQAQSFDVTNWPRGGAYPLVPYHNRLAGAKIKIGDAFVNLRAHPAAMPNTLHGPGHARPWAAGVHEENRFSMLLDYRADEDWPWDFRAEQSFELIDNRLRLSMTVENRSDRPMPGGMGWHPYFASRDPVKSDATHIWHHLPDYLPDGRRSEFDGNAGIAGPTAYLDNWTQAHVTLTEQTSVQIVASDAFTFLVVHRGDPSHVCVEPVTHLANAWNMGVPADNSGAVILAPGTEIHGVIEIAYSRP